MVRIENEVNGTMEIEIQCRNLSYFCLVQLAYRDRAKERREKYGFDDTPEYSKHKLDKESTQSLSAPEMPITNDNIGSRMLKAMGWVFKLDNNAGLCIF